jgi:hypothetical protein
MNKNQFFVICGISSILAVISYLGTVIFSLIVALPETLIETMADYLSIWSDNKNLMAIYGWFGILGSLFTLPAIVGYYMYLQEEERNSQLLPLVIIFHGVVLLTIAYCIPVVISLFIVPEYLGTINTSLQYSLEAITLTLVKLEDFFVKIGSVLTAFTGVALIGLFDLRKKVLPGWLNWLGISSGLLSLAFLGTFGTGTVATVFSIIATISLVIMLIWMVIFGVLLIIYKENDN